MSWWLTTIIILGLLIGLGLGVWGFMNGFDLRKKDYKKIRQEKIKNNNQTVVEIQKQDFILFDQIKSLPKKKFNGIYSLYVGPEINENDFFIPVYLVKSFNVIEDIVNDSQNLIDNKRDSVYAEIIEYLEHQNKNFDDLRWSLLEANIDSSEINDRFDFWLKNSKAKERGFNK